MEMESGQGTRPHLELNSGLMQPLRLLCCRTFLLFVTVIWPFEVFCVSLQAAYGNVAEDTFVTKLWCVFQAQGVLQEYLLAMTTDEQLLNHTAMVRPVLLLSKWKLLRLTWMLAQRRFPRAPKCCDVTQLSLLNHAVPLIEWSSVSVSQLAAGVSLASESLSCWHPADPTAAPPPVLNVCGLYLGLMYLVITVH